MNIQKAILTINSFQVANEDNSLLGRIDSRAFLIVTLVYIFCIISLPLENPEKVIWFATYPILLSPLTNKSYSSVFIKSLLALPLILLIGIFNPYYDRRPAFEFENVTVTYGWLSFITILVRGLLSMQALVLLVTNCGFINVCNDLSRMGVPKVLTTQLLLLYRYLVVLLDEAFNIHRAVVSRGFGKKSFPLKMWVTLVGSLLIRTYERSQRIHNAMLARGFNGYIPLEAPRKVKFKDVIFCFFCIIFFVILYVYDIGHMIPI